MRSGCADDRVRALKRDNRVSIANPYDDDARAATYAALGIVNTYYLAFRDLPAIFQDHGMAGTALDFGCGTGRSTRFLQDHGFVAIGADVFAAMVAQAGQVDPGGDYRVVPPGDLRVFPDATFDLVLSVMPFDSMASRQEKVAELREIGRVLKPAGWKVLVASSRDIYVREWVSFSTAAFPENRSAKNGDVVRVVINDLGDGRIVDDILWDEEAYRDTFGDTPLHLVETRRPVIETEDNGLCAWKAERTHAPWTVFVLRRPADPTEG